MFICRVWNQTKATGKQDNWKVAEPLIDFFVRFYFENERCPRWFNVLLIERNTTFFEQTSLSTFLRRETNEMII